MEILQQLLSPEDYQKYLHHARKNKYSFRRRTLKYKYDEKDCTLYRKIKFSDGIGE